MKLTLIILGIFITLGLVAVSGLQSPIDTYMFAVIITSIIIPLVIVIFLLRIPVSTPIWKRITSWACVIVMIVGFYSFTYIKAVEALKQCDLQKGTLFHNRDKMNAPGSLKCLTKASV